jgi:WD40 repeat protein
VVLFSSKPDLAIESTVELPKAGISDVALRSDDKLFVTAGWDGRIRVFRYLPSEDASSGQKTSSKKCPGHLITVLVYHQAGVNVVLFRTDGLLASGGKDKTVAIWRAFELVNPQG